jgi:hypothetical protein
MTGIGERVSSGQSPTDSVEGKLGASVPKMRPSSGGKETLWLTAMPHVVYVEPFLVCPWAGCDFRIEMIDF